MRIIALTMFLPTCASAWEFSPHPLCTLSHQSESAQIEITYDPGVPEYRMTLNLLAEHWARSENFGITFRGERPLTIGTDRHEIDQGNLTVADTGFGNVLYGLEFNTIAIAFTSAQTEQFSLAGAPSAVRNFRSCALEDPPTS